MPRVADYADRVRSKNAGPFWLTIDIFCADADSFAALARGLPSDRVARAYDQAPETLRRFELADLNVLKFSMPRPMVQGSPEDRDMHASQWAWLLSDLEVDA